MPDAHYTKPHKSLAEQVNLLVNRGLSVPDRSYAESVLGRVGYYRLSGYWYPYRLPILGSTERLSGFTPGTTFNHIVSLYNFDRRLKLHVLDVIERIEIAVRFQTGYILGRRGPHAHTEPSNFVTHFTRSGQGRPSKHATWLQRVQEAQRRSDEDFVKHFNSKYNGELPIWAITEILDFGGITTVYNGTLGSDGNRIAQQLGILDAAGNGSKASMSNWLQVLNYLRNVCAHHSRLWNRNMDRQLSPNNLKPIPSLAFLADLASTSSRPLARVFAPLSVLIFLSQRVAGDGSRTLWLMQLLDILETLPASGRSMKEMGFPAEWRELPIWQNPS